MKIDFRISPTSLTKFLHDKYGLIAEIETDNSTFRLGWGDAVVNEWAEDYNDLATALLRLAVLVKSAENNSAFTTDEDEFTIFAKKFFDQQLA